MVAKRGRPRLELDLVEVLQAIRKQGKVLRAAQELGCSDAYLHQRLKNAGLSLEQVMTAPNLITLLRQVKAEADEKPE